MAFAAAGLARRGHGVRWVGGGPPATGVTVWSERDLARQPPEVLIAGDRTPLATGLLARFGRAAVTVMDLDPARAASWSALGRWAVETPDTWGLIPPLDAEAARRRGAGLPPERIALWPDGPLAVDDDPAHPDCEVLERACERALRRHRGRSPRPAVFLDRDGTLVIERGYLTDPADIELLPGAVAALRRLRDAGYLLVVVSNQSGVGRGFFSASTVYAAMARLRERLRAGGVEPDAIYFCPHRPEAGCACRKPGTLLLERAADDLEISLPRSAMVGDKLLDAETGRRAGGRGLLVRTGYGRDEEARASEVPEASRPDAVVEDLGAAADWILAAAPDATGS